MKIGAQLYTVREYTKTPEDIEKTLRRIKSIGFDVIQISGFGPCDPKLLAGWIKELNLDVCVTHMPWAKLEDPQQLDALIADHKLWGCDQIGLGSRPKDVFENTYEGYTKFIAEVKRISKQLGDAGLSFGYHNHDFEFERFHGELAMDRLINECPDLNFILDTFWVQAGGCDPVDYIRKVQGKMKVCHFKDYKIVDRTRRFAEIGQGNLNWDKIIDACRETSVPYIVIEQDADYVDPFESLAISFDFLQKKIG